jgi:murein DD-endopeptidase MepM/ murein hydrolase activator NlpD
MERGLFIADLCRRRLNAACFFLLFLTFSLAALLLYPQAQAKTTGGIYHPVTPGVTLYRVSQAYKVSIAKLMEANKLSSASAIRAGQKLFIPGAKTVLRVEPYVPLSPSERKNLERSLEKQEEPPPAPSPGKASAKGEGEKPPWAGKELDMIWPIQGKINSRYGPRGKNFHSGIDISSPHYQEVKAAMDGEVILARNSNTGYGRLVVLRHGGAFSTVYGHLNVIIAGEGEAVRQGQAIGGVGSTGNSTGPHLHFELRQAGRALDPLPLLPRTIEDLLEKAAKK